MQEPIKKPEPQSSAYDVIYEMWKAIRPQKWLFFCVIILLALNSVISVFIPLFYKKFFDVLTNYTPDISRSVASEQLISIIVSILLLNVCIWISYRTATFLHIKFQAFTMARIRQNSFNHMIDHSYTFFSNNFTGSLVQRISRFARAFERLTDRLVWNIIPLTISITGISIVVWRIKPIFTGVILGLTFTFIIFNYFFSRWKLKYNLALAESDSKTTGILSDDITNQTTISLFVGSDFERNQVREATNNQAKISNFVWNLSGVVDAVQAGLIFVSEFVLFYISIKYWQAGVISIGTFVLIQVYFLGLGNRLWDFSRIIRDLYEGFADSKEMVDILKTPHEIKDLLSARPMNVETGRISFTNVHFNFNQTRDVLAGVNLIIAGQEKVALIGPSGAGKSTLVRLILRFYEVSKGAIEIDGQDIKYATLDSLREHISFVPQEPILFHRTLMENIRYGRRDATDEEVIEAAKLAHCDEFIQELPTKYETLVGERGIKLSGGERQRIAIARAILKNAPILILDEATSSLDSESEHLIQDALDVLMKGKTVIVIAHRLSTIRKMDRIVVLENGKILEEGNHELLLAQETSLYKKLWNLQAGGFIGDDE